MIEAEQRETLAELLALRYPLRRIALAMRITVEQLEYRLKAYGLSVEPPPAEPLRLALPMRNRRPCATCGVPFMPARPGNRICGRCKIRRARDERDGINAGR